MQSFSCRYLSVCLFFFFFQAEDGIRDSSVTGVQTCALPISDLNGSSFLRSTVIERILIGVMALWRLSAGVSDMRSTTSSQIGRASGRERGEISVGAGSLKKKKEKI